MTDFDPGPSSVRDRDINPKSVGKDDPAEAFYTEEANGDFDVTYPIDEASPQVSNRPLFDSDYTDTTLYCSPNGSREAAGTESDPLTLRGALETVPYFPNRAYIIDLYTVPSSNGNLPAVYDYDGARNIIWSVFNGNNKGEVRIVGNSNDRTDVQLKPTVQMMAWARSDHLNFRDVTFNNGIQTHGKMRLDRCTIVNNNFSSFTNKCIGTKSGIVFLSSTTIGDGTHGTAINVTNNPYMAFQSCTINNDGSQSPIQSNVGGQFSFAFTDSSTNGTATPTDTRGMTDSELGGVIDGAATTLVNHDGRIVITESNAGNSHIHKPAKTV
ncbi:hypothetical protein [Natronomonas gomsonensis]|uniref:hypothetical protein n=1 Tax=Natronomonas gomsonensis TaxID=1046043 RepID=UPI0015BD2342|nr:hypothetical protein [Natronomonas gomsonensis]